MAGKILLLIDSSSVRSDAFSYAVELAARTNSALVVLIVIPLEEAAKGTPVSAWLADTERAIREALARHLETVRRAGVPVQVKLKLGVPPSEVMKFLAESSFIHTIVWGGEPSLAVGTPRSRRAHWLSQIREALECPIVVPLARPRPDERAGRKTKEE